MGKLKKSKWDKDPRKNGRQTAAGDLKKLSPDMAAAEAADSSLPEDSVKLRDDVVESKSQEASRPQETPKPKKLKPGPGPSGPPRPFGPVSFIIAIVVALTIGVYAGTLFNSASAPIVAGGQGGGTPPKESAPPQASASDTARILELEQAVLKNANDLAAWIQLGNIYFDTSKPREAIRAYEHALALKPDNADVLTDLGIMFRETGQYEKAVDSFKKAVNIKPGHQNAMFNTGVVLFFDLGRKDEARKAWRDLLAVNPNARAPDGQPVRDMLENLK